MGRVAGQYLHVPADLNTHYDVPALNTRRPRERMFMPADQPHRITEVEPDTWTFLLCGPVVRAWGFYVARPDAPEALRWTASLNYLAQQ